MIRVIKIGGSLLDWPALPVALPAWVASQPPAYNVLIAGGGALADVIRQADRRFSLGEETSHWLCVDAMSLSARIIAAVLPGIPLITCYEKLLAAATAPSSTSAIFDTADFLRVQEANLPGPNLPHNWSVTSDSIVARLAETLAADELVLLKSSEPPASSPAELSAAGFVDEHFSTMNLAGVRLRFENLRRFPLPQPKQRAEHSVCITS